MCMLNLDSQKEIRIKAKLNEGRQIQCALEKHTKSRK